MNDLNADKRLWRLVEALDQRIDDGAGPAYHEQPLAQDWARVAKVQEEAGEAVDALIGVTAQNHRKGEYGSWEHLFDELADVALTGVYAIQHFTKDVDRTRAIFLARAERHAERVGIDLDMS
jgi:NTP pyrophosphatase (non-canonical NTP hydrolase)